MNQTDALFWGLLVALVFATWDITSHLKRVHISVLEEMYKRFDNLDRSVRDIESELYSIKRLLNPPSGEDYRG